MLSGIWQLRLSNKFRGFGFDIRVLLVLRHCCKRTRRQAPRCACE
jgi:hypothetical protein